MTGTSDSRAGTWEVPECPFSIEYAPAVLEEIRLAVVDAFFSLPRGGAEIGGVLFGSFADGCVRISAFRPTDCEHASGPGFVLSERDHARLRDLLRDAASDTMLRGMVPVGWYHSHTRSEIFLSDLDLEIHHRYFPEPWQVALVLRPAGTKPTRAGFFFRAKDGSIRSASSYQEFVVNPVGGGDSRRPAAVIEIPRGAHSIVTSQVPGTTPSAAALDGHAAVAPPPVLVPAPLPKAEMVLSGQEAALAKPPIEMAAEFMTPKFLKEAGKPRHHVWSWLALALLLASIAGAYFSRAWWMGALSPKRVALSLQSTEADGQLRIQWDRTALANQPIEGGLLEITDGGAKIVVPLDTAHVRAGSFQYERRSEMVEVHMMVRLAKQRPLEEFMSYIGRATPASTNKDDAGQQEALAAEAEKARGDLKKQELRTLQLERSLEQMRQILAREEERKRAENQRTTAPPPSSPPGAPAAQRAASSSQQTSSSPPQNTPPVQTANTNSQPASRPAAPVQTPAQTPAQPPAEKPATQNTAPPPTTQRPAPPVEQPKPPVTQQPAPAVEQAKPPAPKPVETPAAPAPKPVETPAAPAPKPVETPAAPAPKPVGGPSLAGSWITLRSADSASVYPPVAVNLQITEKDGVVRGTLTGSYRVPKTVKFAPQVALAFAGPDTGGTLKMPYNATGGGKGVIELIRLPGKANTIEVVWRPEGQKFVFDDLFFRAR